jgi:glucose-1-phosphate thymidylyltransferase
MQASHFIEAIETRQGMKVACLEEIAFRKGFITSDQLGALINGLENGYGQYLREVLAASASG